MCYFIILCVCLCVDDICNSIWMYDYISICETIKWCGVLMVGIIYIYLCVCVCVCVLFIYLFIFCNFGRLCIGNLLGFCLGISCYVSNQFCISSGS